MPDRSARELRQAERQVRGTFHDAECRWPEPDAGEVERKDRGYHFVTDVREERGEHDPDERA